MPVRGLLRATLVVALGTICSNAQAQSTVPGVNLTFTGGHAGFVDESVINHAVFGAGAEWVATRRVAVGPEVLYMNGPGTDRDLFVIGMARFGLLPFDRRVAPFVTAAGGLMVHWVRFGRETFRSSEGTFMFGGGARVTVSRNVYVAPEVTIGWEPHLRTSVNVGIRLP